MTWNDFHARTDLLNEVLRHAETDMPQAWRLMDSAHAGELFNGAGGVLLALQQRWTTHLAALLDAAIEEGFSGRWAWQELARRQPALRAVLDAGAARSAQLRHGQLGEQRMMNEHIDFQFHSMTTGVAGPGTAPAAGAARLNIVRAVAVE